MTIFQALVLGIVQGATEFIPVSSSGHLTLVPWLLNWTFDPTLKGAFDVIAHWGTLLAVVGVLWRDLLALVRGGLRTVRPRWPRPAHRFLTRLARNAEGRLAWLILIGSLPAAAAGLLFEDFFEMLFGTPRIVSLLLLVTAGLLAASEWLGRPGRDLPTLTVFDALCIGIGQATAIAPGISRSGATMAFGLARGIRRDGAARFSFLLATPVILGAGMWQLKDLLGDSSWLVHLPTLLIGFVASGLSGYLCIHFLLGYLRRGKLYPFAVYCTVAGLACLILSFIR